jgi:speckle-type POZ protein
VDDLGGEDGEEMFRDLLVAADRYEVKRLKLMCEDNLCKSLSTDSVAAAVAFAEEHNLCNLKDACIEFIAFSEKIHGVLASQGYKNLKRSHPPYSF